MYPRRVTRLLLASLSALTLSACLELAALNPVVTASLRLAADPASAPLAESLLNSYESLHPSARLSLAPMNREDALAAVESGEADAALLLHPLADETVFSTPLARERVIVIAHPALSVDSLTRRDVRAILSGQVTDWPRSDDSTPQPIHITMPAAGSSARLALDGLVLQGQTVTGSARLAATDEQMLALVAGTPGSIGVTTGSFLNDSVKPLDYEGAAPTVENARSNSYRLVTPVVFVAAAEPDGALRGFLDWALSADGQAVVRRHMLSVSD